MKEENPLNYMFLEEETVNFREIFEKYLYHWKWFVLGALLAIVAAFLYLRYTPNEYLVSSTILIDDEASGGLPSELSAFEDLGLMGGTKKSIDTEIGLLKSRSLMTRVVKDLGINATYYKKGRVRTAEVYKTDVPFNINYFSKDSLVYKLDTTFSIIGVSNTNFKLVAANGEKRGEHLFGEKVNTAFGAMIITPKSVTDTFVNDELLIKIAPLKSVVESLRKKLAVELLFKKSSLIALSLKGTIKLKSEDILNGLVEQYNKDAVEDKSLIGTNTDAFINERLAVIEKDLSNVDKGVEQFKTTNKLTDIPSEATLVLENNAVLEKKIVELNTQIKLADYVIDYLSNNEEQLFPANLGLKDGNVNLNSEKYNELLLERNRILKNSSKKHPIVVNLDAQINQLRASIAQSLVNLKSSLNISLQQANQEERKVHSRIFSVPKQERQFRDIQRQQQIIETLYLYLLQKREENAISLAVTVPNAKIIDAADGSTIPVSPKRKIVYLAALMLGLLIPFMVLYIIFLFDNKVHSSKDVEDIIKAPILGEIPKTDLEQKMVVGEHDRDSIAESFRMLRTHLNFMLSGVKTPTKTIFVTSTVPAEGKTFVALNLARVLALSNKKVLLIGADIRKPKIHEYLNIDFDKGLTHFLVDNTLKLKDIIHHYKEGSFDVLSAGIVAPNPSELLMNGRFDEVLAYGKENYDFVIVDTAPVKLVSDTLLLSQHSDLSLYVIRANYLDKRLLEIPEKMYKDKLLPNMALLLNDVDVERGYGYGGYGYGYGGYGGYGEEKPKKAWWRF
ncbi:GumC family protein [Lutibacter flavus]|uniref:non-specific protein-tyrosine kinase n=1 Tax=Lutibacter flavus TaxID=691689 RepID=A0A238VRH5_9FLAO|nr:polysaccharide biosynthesis tyrosine autokinase [Lutibacter flavus]SNR36925.1 capsular exopolysaccharide family [Lutibacter flavus]